MLLEGLVMIDKAIDFGVSLGAGLLTVLGFIGAAAVTGAFIGIAVRVAKLFV